MVVSKIIELAQDTVQDDSFANRMLGFVNRAIGNTAVKVALPALTRIDVAFPVSALTASLVLPEDYSRGLFMAFDADGRRLNVFPGSFMEFRRKHPDYLTATGTAVRAVAVLNNKLFVYPQPTQEQTVYLSYQAKPPVLSLTGKIEDVIPDPYGDEIVESFICAECFTRIEDGIEGRKTNTEYYQSRYQIALAELEAFIGTRDSEPQTILDECEI